MPNSVNSLWLYQEPSANENVHAKFIEQSVIEWKLASNFGSSICLLCEQLYLYHMLVICWSTA